MPVSCESKQHRITDQKSHSSSIQEHISSKSATTNKEKLLLIKAFADRGSKNSKLSTEFLAYDGRHPEVDIDYWWDALHQT
jgi:hypothetical protein